MERKVQHQLGEDFINAAEIKLRKLGWYNLKSEYGTILSEDI